MPPGDGDFSDGEIWQVEDGFGHTATVYGDDEEGAANARLIAAAPDLLAALRLFVNEGPSRARQCNCDDYEPGIHLSQSQMQSGCTGMNTLRIYSPAKQLRDQDPDGVFVRRWLPELAMVPTAWLAEPHQMPETLAREVGFDPARYPPPLVDAAEAPKQARALIWAVRRTPEVKALAQQVVERHGSRKRRARTSGPRKRTREGSAGP